MSSLDGSFDQDDARGQDSQFEPLCRDPVDLDDDQGFFVDPFSRTNANANKYAPGMESFSGDAMSPSHISNCYREAQFGSQPRENDFMSGRGEFNLYGQVDDILTPPSGFFDSIMKSSPKASEPKVLDSTMRHAPVNGFSYPAPGEPTSSTNGSRRGGSSIFPSQPNSSGQFSLSREDSSSSILLGGDLRMEESICSLGQHAN